MKKKIFIYTFIMGIFLSSCFNESSRLGLDIPEGTFVLNYSILGQGTETQSRATVPSVAGEEEIQSLDLLFFTFSENGSGKFVDYYEVLENVEMNSSIPISFSNNPELKNDESYIILAVANLNQTNYLSSSVSAWIESEVKGSTENEVILKLMAYCEGVGRNDQDNSCQILPTQLLMSGRTSKIADQKEVELNLTRGLVRFDVQNLQNDKFDLVSVSIWNAPVYAPIWTGEKYDTPGKLERFYGIHQTREAEDTEPLPQITGGLYCFENFVSSPEKNDKVTTCIIVGISPREDDNPLFTKPVTYHRINVHPEDGGQNIKRNNVYKISINNVNGEGADSEEEAWSQGTNSLDLIINNWNLDDNGMVLTDGKNTLVIPVKRVLLDPAGDEREYSIYSLGDGEPFISKRDVPLGINIELIGSRLIVTAEALPVGIEERKAMVEIALGDLRGEINFIQAPNVNEYLSLNHIQLSSFPATGKNSIPDGYIEVTCSGSWTAKIYNNDTDPVNPGFSFKLSEVSTELTQEDNKSNQVQIYTTGGNDKNDPRYSFVIFTLDANPEITRSLVLSQRGATNLNIDPEVSSLTFSPTGEPSSPNDAIVGNCFRFIVDPGWESDGVLNKWDAEIDNTKFRVVAHNKNRTDKSQQILEVYSEGFFTEGSAAIGNLKIYQEDGAGSINLRVSQAALRLELNLQGSTVIPAIGGELKIKVDTDETLEYKVEIISAKPLSHHGHTGYLVDDNGNKLSNEGDDVSGRTIDKEIIVGFPKLLTPNVNVSPEFTIRVTVETLTQDVTIKQTEIKPKAINVLNFTTAYRGSYTKVTHGNYNLYYNYALRNTNWFGPNGIFYIPSWEIGNSNWGLTNTSTIPSSFNHVNAQIAGLMSTTAALNVVNWVKANEGVLVINDDYYHSKDGFKTDKLYHRLGYTVGSNNGRPVMNSNSNVTQSKVWKYIIGGEGPFGEVTVGALPNFAYDGERVTFNINSIPSTAVPIVVDGGGNVQIMIDPVNRIVFNGELQIFTDTQGLSAEIGTMAKPNSDMHRFLANYIAFIHNMAMYGTHFTDHFLDGADTSYPYDYKP